MCPPKKTPPQEVNYVSSLMLEGSEKNLNGLRGAKKVNEFYREGSEFINRRPRAEVGGREHFRHAIEGETKSFSFFRL